jgi:hypothetical protein
MVDGGIGPKLTGIGMIFSLQTVSPAVRVELYLFFTKILFLGGKGGSGTVNS